MSYRSRVTAMGPKSDVLGGGFRVGDTLGGRYVLEKRLGRGGMGVVVAARRIADGQRVAIKLLLTENAPEQSPKYVARLIREAKATAALGDEHVVRLYDVDTLEDGTCFLVMELLEGQDLAKHVKTRGPLPLSEAVDLVLQASSGVAEAHARGIVHRDLKPHNLFLARRAVGDPIVKVLDFGISKVDEGDDAPLTTTGAVLGSPQYMSIEQFQNSKGVDRRADIWALGMILHHLLTGRTAYEAPDVATYLFRLSAESPTPVRVHRQELPQAIENIILRCLEKNPNARFRHVGEFAQGLAPFAGPAGQAAIARIQHYAAFTPQLAAAPVTRDDLRAPNSDYGTSPVHSGTNDAVTREYTPKTTKSRSAMLLSPMIAAGIVIAGLAIFLSTRSAPHSEAPAKAAPPSPAPVAAANVIITVIVSPANATLELDGQVVKSPFEVPRTDKERTLIVRADGYEPKTRMVRPTANAYLEISLDKGPVTKTTTDTAAIRPPQPGPVNAPAPAPTTNKKKLKGPMSDSL